MGSNKIKVGMGEGVVTIDPKVVLASGIGSCVVVTLFDRRRKIGGLAHIMLPDSASVKGPRGSYECADTAIIVLREGLRSRGAHLDDLEAKMAGGARMFSSYEDRVAAIGGQNIHGVKHALKKERIPLVGWDVAGDHGRSVEFHLASGQLIVRAIGKADKQI